MAEICARNYIIGALSFIVFLFFDLLDFVLCKIYGFLDEAFEGRSFPCYCRRRAQAGSKNGEGGLSETLFGRKNVFRELGFSGLERKWEDSVRSASGVVGNRWSDCRCESCVSWMKNGDQKLHIVVREPSEAITKRGSQSPKENVIFLHGFISSSSFWTETVFLNLSEPVKQNYRLFSVDLLGFGRSPKPRDCLYTLKDHLEMIEKSVISFFHLDSFHIVGHSMGCIVALALGAKYSKTVRSITLIAPPYISSSKGGASLRALSKFAERTLWPPLVFGSSLMSWYEHLGRCVCFIFCRNHRAWECCLKLLTRKRDLHFLLVDLTKHTHHSAWHTFHNVLCGGAEFMDAYLDALMKSKVKMTVIQGGRDNVVPLDCLINLKMKVPDIRVDIVKNANHMSVVLGREKDFTHDLEQIWASVSENGIRFLKK